MSRGIEESYTASIRRIRRNKTEQYAIKNSAYTLELYLLDV